MSIPVREKTERGSPLCLLFFVLVTMLGLHALCTPLSLTAAVGIRSFRLLLTAVAGDVFAALFF